jgi:hypothetical protein
MTKSLLTILAVLSALTPVSGGATELTSENNEEKMTGKNSFIKFQAPWYVFIDSLGSFLFSPSQRHVFLILLYYFCLYFEICDDLQVRPL